MFGEDIYACICGEDDSVVGDGVGEMIMDVCLPMHFFSHWK